MSKRKRYSSEFKSRVVLEALREDGTLSEIASKYGVHPVQVAKWKKQALQGMAAIFESPSKDHEVEHAAEVKELHAKIGQLTVERDFLARAFDRCR